MNNINDPVIKQMLETAAYGEAAKMFMQSDLGKHIASRATDEIEEAMNALINVSPTNVEAISALQRKANNARGAIQWLMETISAGDNALRQLEEE